MPIRYFLIPSKVKKYISGNLTFTETTISDPPNHLVNWNNENDVSKTYTTKPDGKPFVGTPKAGDLLNLALSEAYCIKEKISTVNREKKPIELDASTPLVGDWFALRVANPQSLVLTLANGKTLDLTNLPLALPASVHFDAEGKLAVLLTQAGRTQLGLPGLNKFEGSLADFYAGSGPATGTSSAGGTDKKKLKELLLALAAVLD